MTPPSPPPRYRDWQNLRCRLLWCYDDAIRADPGRVQRGSIRAFAQSSAWLVRSGWAEVEHDGRRLRAWPGQWLIVRPTLRDQRFAPGTKLLSIAFEARWPDGSHWLDAGLSRVLVADACPALERRALTMARIMNRVAPETWDARDHRMDHRTFLRLESALTAWLAELVDALAPHGVVPSRKDPLDERVLAAVRWLDALPHSGALDVDALVHLTGISAVHLDRLMRRHMGTTVKAYRDHLRVEHACRRLALPGVQIKAVAAEVGFADLSLFSRWFQRLAGQRPRAYARGRQGSDQV